AAQLVAQKVDDHHIFGTILGAGEQGAGLLAIFLRRRAPWPGALDRSAFHLTVAHLDKALGRVAEDVAVGSAEEAGEGRRAGGAQGAVGLPGVALACGAETRGAVDRSAVAGADVVVEESYRALVQRGVLAVAEGSA